MVKRASEVIGRKFRLLALLLQGRVLTKTYTFEVPVLGQNKLRTWRGRRVDSANDLELIEVSATALRPLIQKLRSFVLNRSFHKLKVQLRVFL